jgi:hypothetical protein
LETHRWQNFPPPQAVPVIRYVTRLRLATPCQWMVARVGIPSKWYREPDHAGEAAWFRQEQRASEILKLAAPSVTDRSVDAQRIVLPAAEEAEMASDAPCYLPALQKLHAAVQHELKASVQRAELQEPPTIEHLHQLQPL